MNIHTNIRRCDAVLDKAEGGRRKAEEMLAGVGDASAMPHASYPIRARSAPRSFRLPPSAFRLYR